MPKWIKGQSGNLKGRPKKQTAITDLARYQLEKPFPVFVKEFITAFLKSE
jgi:hypothetical protein